MAVVTEKQVDINSLDRIAFDETEEKKKFSYQLISP
jgi:hypothetical protein